MKNIQLLAIATQPMLLPFIGATGGTAKPADSKSGCYMRSYCTCNT